MPGTGGGGGGADGGGGDGRGGGKAGGSYIEKPPYELKRATGAVTADTLCTSSHTSATPPWYTSQSAGSRLFALSLAVQKS